MTDEDATAGIAARLAAAAVEVKPLVFKTDGSSSIADGIGGSHYITWMVSSRLWWATSPFCPTFIKSTYADAVEVCNKNHAAAVMSMLQLKGESRPCVQQ